MTTVDTDTARSGGTGSDYTGAMRIALGADHAGVHLKADIKQLLDARGIPYTDFGVDTTASVDYPDYAIPVARRVSGGKADRGILICGTGHGMCIAANKFPGIRAAPCHDDLTAEMSRRHNDANVLCLSADLLGTRLVNRMVERWVMTEFEGGRHARRVKKIAEIERETGPAGRPSAEAATS